MHDYSSYLTCKLLELYQIQKNTLDDNEIKCNHKWIKRFKKWEVSDSFSNCSKYKTFDFMRNRFYHSIFIVYMFLFYFSSLFMHITNLTSCWEVNWILLKLLNYANYIINPQHWPQVYIYKWNNLNFYSILFIRW